MCIGFVQFAGLGVLSATSAFYLSIHCLGFVGGAFGPDSEVV